MEQRGRGALTFHYELRTGSIHRQLGFSTPDSLVLIATWHKTARVYKVVSTSMGELLRMKDDDDETVDPTPARPVRQDDDIDASMGEHHEGSLQHW